MFSLINPFNHFIGIVKEITNINQILIDHCLAHLRNDAKYNSPKNLIPYGYKIYSQCDEDGIISEIFNRIGKTNRQFVEFGVGNGLENNTLALLLQDWRGLWIESSKKHVRKIHKSFKDTIQNGSLAVINEYVTKDNINSIIASVIKDQEIDLLAVDIDGNDYHIISEIKCVSPRVIVMEYNAKFPPPVQFCMEYNPRYKWCGDDGFGASIKFLELNLALKNYVLVGCSISGCNAFFIRKDLIGDQFQGPFTSEHHYEPPRYYLTKLMKGHPTNHRTIDNTICSSVK